MRELKRRSKVAEGGLSAGAWFRARVCRPLNRRAARVNGLPDHGQVSEEDDATIYEGVGASKKKKSSRRACNAGGARRIGWVECLVLQSAFTSSRCNATPRVEDQPGDNTRSEQ